MADVVQLPIDSSSYNYTVATALDDTVYQIDVRWNDVLQLWYLDLLDIDRNMIVSGIAIVIGCALGGQCVDARMPPGVIMVADLSAAATGAPPRDAGVDDLGSRVVVLYYPVDTIPVT